MEINKDNFSQEIINSSTPALIDFYATWCGPCKAIAPMIESLKSEFTGQVNVVKIDVDENPELAQLYNIKSLPTLMFFKNGDVINTIKGSVPKQKLLDVINTII